LLNDRVGPVHDLGCDLVPRLIERGDGRSAFGPARRLFQPTKTRDHLDRPVRDAAPSRTAVDATPYWDVATGLGLLLDVAIGLALLLGGVTGLVLLVGVAAGLGVATGLGVAMGLDASTGLGVAMGVALALLLLLPPPHKIREGLASKFLTAFSISPIVRRAE